jgi:two-component system, NarL family, invasion response regulator UvrY
MLRVVVVDDHPIIREGLKRIIAESPGFFVAGEASNGVEALQVVEKNPCDLVVLDISMPNKNGMDVLKQIKAQMPRLPVLVLSVHSEDQYAVRALKAGASGYLTKDAAPAQLLNALRKVVHGGKYVSTTLAEKLATELDMDNERPVHEALSDREYQVLCMLASGKTGTEIANELTLSVKTISTYRARILEKLKMKNNAEITRYAIKKGLVD